MKLPFIITLTLLPFLSSAQSEQKEINQQVWLPFIQAFNDNNTTTFMNVHHKDLARVPRDAKVIYTFNEYKQIIDNGNKKARTSNIKRTIELRFTERIASPTQAFEVGIYKTTITQPQAEPQTSYGKFTVLLRKENNTWKIIMDSDATEKNTITANDFIAAEAID